MFLGLRFAPLLLCFTILTAPALAPLAAEEGCRPRALSLDRATLNEDQKAYAGALFAYYDALNRKDFTALKGILDPDRTVDTSPGPNFSYRSMLNWKQFRIYATEIVSVDPILGQVRVHEEVEALAYNGAIFFYNSPAIYSFRDVGGKLLLTSRGLATVNRESTKDPFDLLFLFRDTLYRGDTSGALGYLQRLLQIYPDHYYVQAMMGAAIVQARGYPEGFPHLQRAIILRKRGGEVCSMLGSRLFDAQVYDALAACYLISTDQAAAREHAQYALTLNPNYVPALLHMAEFETAAGNEEKAREWYIKAYWVISDLPEAEVILFGNPAFGNNRAGMAALSQGRLEDAAKMFSQAIKDNPYYDKPYNNLGLVREKQGKAKEALSLYSKANETNPRNSATLLNVASLYKKEGERKMAETTIKRVLEMDPENLAALNFDY